MAEQKYYLPQPSYWPLIGSVGLFTTTFGFASALPGKAGDPMGNMLMMYIGLAILAFMMFGWFSTVVRESEAGKYNMQVDMSFRMGMMWFIFSEVMFFAAFFGALFYARQLSVPWLAGGDPGTNELLWKGFQQNWPLLQTPEMAVKPDADLTFSKASGVIEAWGVPFYNTLILLTSGLTVTFAHWALKQKNRTGLILWLCATVVLGYLFVGLQASEYGHAYHALNLKLSSGIYGTTFFMLTGFHGLHVTIGATMLLIITLRSIKGHFTPERHFAFEAVAWYWHFVDVVWLGLFIFVYWL
ncbi:MAG: cytochrome c oxidase subunit 3 [Gammaproteobacteria bacterium]|nr:cytochrome c oxidase subunit 3 [Gammaproteobacteria bacterium]